MANIKKLIEDKGGIFVNTFYENKRKYVVFECENKHLNEKRVDTMNGKSATCSTWCMYCLRNTIKDAHKLAKKMGLIFLSEKYIDSYSKYDWKCKNGHIFSALYYNILGGKGCKQCHRISLDSILKKVSEKGGKCIVENYTSLESKLNLECSEGHKWTTKAMMIHKGAWCPKCQESICERTCRKILEFIYKKEFPKKRPEWMISRFGGRLELDGYCESLNIAFEYNGQQHYNFVPYWYKTEEKFIQQKQRDEDTVKKCLEHNVKLIIIPYTVPYNQLYTYILQKCTDYPSDTPKTIDYEILNLESYNKSRLQEVSDYVKKKWDGTLLSSRYVNNTTPLEFRCKNNHILQQAWGSIIAGIFCKKCTYETVRNNMSIQVEEFMNTYNFILLVPYIKAKKPIIVKCKSCEKQYTSTWDSFKNKTRFCCYSK